MNEIISLLGYIASVRRDAASRTRDRLASAISEEEVRQVKLRIEIEKFSTLGSAMTSRYGNDFGTRAAIVSDNLRQEADISAAKDAELRLELSATEAILLKQERRIEAIGNLSLPDEDWNAENRDDGE